MKETKETANFKQLLSEAREQTSLQEGEKLSSPLRIKSKKVNDAKQKQQVMSSIFDLEVAPQRMMETLKYNQYEQEQYYVHELNQLKNELELFEQEEEKILQMIIHPEEPMESPKRTDMTLDLIENQNECLNMNLLSKNNSEDENALALDNLKEAFLELQNVLNDQANVDSLIKPVKILSPADVSKIVTNTTPEKYPVTSQSILSVEKLGRTQQSFATTMELINHTPNQDNKSARQFEITRDSDNFRSTQKLTDTLHNPLILGNDAQSKTMNGVTRSDKKTTPLSHLMRKSPSQTAIKIQKQQIDQEDFERATQSSQAAGLRGGASSSGTHTPVKSRLRSDSRLLRQTQQQQVMNKLKHSNTKQDLLSGKAMTGCNERRDSCVSEMQAPSLEAIEIMAKRKSLAIGLKQQEEPDFEDLRQKGVKFADQEERHRLRTQSSGLRFIKPILMDQPCSDEENAKAEQNDSDSGEVRLEIIRDESEQ